MSATLPFFNWSLKKALDTETDNLSKARIRIIYTILLISLVKALVAFASASHAGQELQAARAGIAFVFYLGLVKMLLAVPGHLRLISHIMLCAGALLIWSNIFWVTHKINLILLQFVFMMVLSGFYTLGRMAGIIYSIIGVLPVLFIVIFGANLNLYTPNASQELTSPGFEIIVILNFATIIIAHYLFFKAFQNTITKEEKLNQQLQLAVTEANNLATAKSNFLSTMSHELRTPLNAVIGTAELLLEDKPEERQKENLKILQFSALDLLSLINNILDFNKIESEKLALEQIPVHLAGLMKNICAGLRIKAADKQLDFKLNIDEQLAHLQVLTDPTRLSQIIYNLAGNALKFTEKGNVTVTLACVRKTAEHAEVMFTVSDTGVGIHADKHESIFEMFAQAESNVARKYGGTGLGLPIVKQLLKLFGSSIQLESSLGNGTKFFFTIPFIVTHADETEKAITPQQKTDLSHLRILIAEDNDINRLIMKKQMATLAIEPVIVENGKQAYETCENTYFDAVFMDLHMPVADGYEAIKHIRAFSEVKKANMHVIAFTASVAEKDKILASGFDDFLYKPANMQDLREKLEKIAQKLT